MQLVDNLAQLLFAYQERQSPDLKQVFRIGTVHKAQILRDRLVKDDAAQRWFR